MAQALYRKYRSRSFDEVVGQEHVTTTLKNALKNGKISHAYLFTGPHGVGKTSVARVLAHEINNLDYKNDDIHLDIIEIDAASNRRIDEIRELRDRVHIAPTSAKYKVYIIDEVHMLTREAFNALLKTLEEPPEHCIFILATTEAHKLPDTIISRTQRFNFKAIDKHHSVDHLTELAKHEKIDITQGALELLADYGAGSFRDSIGLLDQLSSEGRVDEQKVLNFLGLPPASAANDLIEQINAGQTRNVLDTLEQLRGQGVDAAVLAKQLSAALRGSIVSGTAEAWQPALLKELLAVPASNDPDGYLEISLLEAAGNNMERNQEIVIRPELPKESNLPAEKKDNKAEDQAKISKGATHSGQFSLGMWPQVVEKARSQNGPLYSTLRLASAEFSDDTLTLSFDFPLHQKKLQKSENLNLLGELVEELSGQKVKISSKLSGTEKKARPAKLEPAAINIQNDSPLESISNIFGNAEVLES